MAPRSSIMFASAALALLSASAVMANLGALGGLGGGAGSFESAGGVSTHQEEAKGLGGLFGGLGGLGGGLGGLLGGGVAKDLKGENKLDAGEGLEKKVAEKEAAKEGFLGIKGPAELIKVLLNPLELLGKIAAFFKLQKNGLVEGVGKGVTFGIEVALQPALLSIKIIEKVFVPDACRLKFVCELGKPVQVLKGALPKFSPGFLDGASTLKALSDGIHGHECEHLYPCGEGLKLKKEFELLKNPAGNKLDEVKGGQLHEAFQNGHDQEHFGGDHQHFGGDLQQHQQQQQHGDQFAAAASNQSPSTVRKDGEPLATAAQ